MNFFPAADSGPRDCVHSPVNLPTPVVEIIRRAPAVSTRMQRGLAWLTDLLAELAFSKRFSRFLVPRQVCSCLASSFALSGERSFGCVRALFTASLLSTEGVTS